MPREKFVRLYEFQHGLIYKWENEVNDRIKIDDLDDERILNVVHSAVRRGHLSIRASGAWSVDVGKGV